MNAINRDRWEKRDVEIYNKWLEGKTQDNPNYTYFVTASINPYQVFDAVQFKHDIDDGRCVDWCYIELKGRQIPIEKYSDAVIEKSKADALLQLGESNGKDVFVVSIYYPSGKLAIWKLENDNNYKVETKLCPYHTADNDGEMVNKEMVLLPLSQAKIYRFGN